MGTDDLGTLPTWSVRLGFPIDVARALLRKDPALSALGVRFGPARLFTRAEAERVRAAIEARKAAASD